MNFVTFALLVKYFITIPIKYLRVYKCQPKGIAVVVV